MRRWVDKKTKKEYTKSIPDWLANATTTVGKEIPLLTAIMLPVFGEHSTGLGAVFPDTARTAWENHLGKERADAFLPKNDLDLQFAIESNDQFNIHSIAATLANEARGFGCSSKEDREALSYEDWERIIPHYNGGPVKNDDSIRYAKLVIEYLPWMKSYLQ